MPGRAEARKWESSLWCVGSHILLTNSGIFLGKGSVPFKSLAPVSLSSWEQRPGKGKPVKAKAQCYWSRLMFP